MKIVSGFGLNLRKAFASRFFDFIFLIIPVDAKFCRWLR